MLIEHSKKMSFPEDLSLWLVMTKAIGFLYQIITNRSFPLYINLRNERQFKGVWKCSTLKLLMTEKQEKL